MNDPDRLTLLIYAKLLNVDGSWTGAEPDELLFRELPFEGWSARHIVNGDGRHAWRPTRYQVENRDGEVVAQGVPETPPRPLGPAEPLKLEISEPKTG